MKVRRNGSSYRSEKRRHRTRIRIYLKEFLLQAYSLYVLCIIVLNFESLVSNYHLFFFFSFPFLFLSKLYIDRKVLKGSNLEKFVVEIFVSLKIQSFVFNYYFCFRFHLSFCSLIKFIIKVLKS